MRTPSLASSAVILAVRVLLVAGAAGAVVLAFVVSRPDGHAQEGSAVVYVCPMHPNVVSSAPGDCPTCRMALEPTTRRPGSPGHGAAGESEPTTLSLPAAQRLHRFDAVARVKVFEIALEMRAPAWAEDAGAGIAILHKDEGELVTASEEGIFFPSSRHEAGTPPGIKIVMTGGPPAPWDRASVSMRFRVGPGARLRAGQTGTIKLATRNRNRLVVRDSAILQSPEGPYVLVVSDDRRTLVKRPIEIGGVRHGYAALIAGLRENEYVVASHTSFLDAERRFGGGAL